MFASKYDHIIVPSTHTQSHFRSILGDKPSISVVHNGIYTGKRKPAADSARLLRELKPDKNKKLIATICRIDSNKRVDIFIDSLCELLKYRDDFTGIVIGSGDDDELLKSLKVKAESADVPVYFRDQMSHENILDLYSGIDLLMINSDNETFSMVTIEAMEENCIVLARRVGGINDIIQDNINGFFYEYTADIKTIAEKINSILNLKNSGKLRIKKNAHMHVQKNFQHRDKVEKLNRILSLLTG